jgi:ribosomal protein L11 methyltransferase
MATVRLVVTTTKKLAPLVSEALFGAGAQGLEERPGRGATLVTYAETRQILSALWKRAQKSLASVLDPALLPTASIEVDAVETWRTAWTEHLRPVQLTRRLLLAPTSAAAPTLTRSQTLILYQPALAFGDGDHPTTRLASRAIEAHYRRTPGGVLLDIGAGTGVLSFVAVHSGARRALGIDIDPEAVRAAQANAALNGLTTAMRFIATDSRVSGTFDLAVINIELRPLLQVLSTLPAAARRVPKLYVTGFLASQLAQVSAAVKAAGFTRTKRKGEGDWLLLEAARSP